MSHFTAEDIIEDADAIKAAAKIVLGEFVRRREAMDAEGMHDAPLFILAGEIHSNVSHKLLHYLIIKGLHEMGENTMVGYECPHNVTSESFFMMFEKAADEAIADILSQGDEDGRFGILTESAMLVERYGAHAGKVIRNYMLENTAKGRLTNCFADAACADGKLDLSDSFTRMAVEAAGKMRDTDFTSADAIYARNHHMANRLMTKAQKTEARFVYHMTGIAHVYGSQEYPVEESLKAILDNYGQEAITMQLLSMQYDEMDFPEGLDLDSDDIITISGLSEKIAIYSDKLDLPEEHVDFLTPEDEAAYVNALLIALGEDKYVKTPAEIEEISETSMEELVTQHARWAKTVYGLTLG